MIWVCHMQHHVARQISQFVKSIHNSSPISLASPCRLLCYPREDRCGSEALWDPDGTFPTIRFGLPLENDPFPVCDTNASSSASNEMTPPNENLKNTFSFCLQYFFIWVQIKSKCFVFACLWIMRQTACTVMHFRLWLEMWWRNDCLLHGCIINLWICFQGNPHTASLCCIPCAIYHNINFLCTNIISRGKNVGLLIMIFISFYPIKTYVVLSVWCIAG